MESNPETAALTVALALVAGTAGQAVAGRLGVPSLVVLLVVGVLLGPEVAGWIHPAAMGDAMFTLVGFAVAVILFEGGLNLQVARLKRQQRVIWCMITLGALVTAVGATTAAHLLLAWPLPHAALFGCLVIVTGPTVVTPLLKRFRVERTTATVLEAEGVLIDPVGAIVAMVALDVVLSTSNLTDATLHALMGLVGGSLLGGVAGLGLGYLLRQRRWVPSGLENVLTLSVVLALFHVANVLVVESGIAAVTVAGMTVGHMRSHVSQELLEFKEQLTAMMIGMLFVLLAAGVRLTDVTGLGWSGAGVVLALLLLVRPLGVMLSTLGSELSYKQRLFMAWIGPRGIVAAAVASLFAVELGRAGLSGGRELQALVFAVIGASVLVAGFTGGTVARWLGLGRPRDEGWLVLGADELALSMARALQQAGESVLCIDTNPQHVHAAQAQGVGAILGNGLAPRTLRRASIDTRAGVIGATPNSVVNLRFAERAKREAPNVRRYVGIERSRDAVNREEAETAGVGLLFGRSSDLEQWAVRVRQGKAKLQHWLWQGPLTEGLRAHPLRSAEDEVMLPLLWRDQGRVRPVDASTELREGCEVWMLVNTARANVLGRYRHTMPWRVPADEQPLAAE